MSVRMRHTRAHTRNRRSHHALKEPRFSRCEKCGKEHIRHRMCQHCGSYRGREVINVAEIEKRKQERRKEKMKALGKDPKGKDTDKSEDSASNKPGSERHDATKAGRLDASALSQRTPKRVKK